MATESIRSNNGNDPLAQRLPVVPALATVIDRGMVPVAEVVNRVRHIQDVMTTLMKDGVHFGTIPGTDKPTLYQPGAELLCATFRIAPKPSVDDLSNADEIRYRVTMAAISQTTGEVLGEGVGECSTSEEKYRWRRPTCDEEWTDTPIDRRREKWFRGRNGNWKAKQVRTSPADVANTVLKMAYKRGLVSMTRVVLACSDIFHQDLEDLPEEVRESVLDNGRADGGRRGAPQPPVQMPERKAAAASESKPAGKSTGTTAAAPAPSAAPASTAAPASGPAPAFDAETHYHLTAVHQPNPAKHYKVLETREGVTFHTWSSEVMSQAERALAGSVPVRMTQVDCVDFPKAPFRVKALVLIAREPGEDDA